MIERSVIVDAMPFLLMALAMFFILSPGYEETGVSFGVISWVWQWFCLANRWDRRWSLVFLGTIGLLWLSQLIGNEAITLHLRALAFGLLIFTSAYLMVRNRSVFPAHYALFMLALPLIMHLALFLWAIPLHLFNSTNGSWMLRVESLRVSAQIGPKLLSQALALLIAISCYEMFYGERIRRVFGAIFCVACVCLALLDSRAAYMVLAVGIIIASFVRHRKAHRQHNDSPTIATAERLRQLKQLTIGVAIFCLVLATLVGWHRFKNLDTSIQAALHHDAYTSWITPDTWLKEFCPPTQERCIIDQSIYLRLSWLRFGTTVIFDHPLGLGPSTIPLARAINLYYPEIAAANSIYDSAHSGVMDIGFNYVMPGIFALFILMLLPLRMIWRCANTINPPSYLPLLACLWGICITRGLIDGLGASLWLTAWVYAGFILGLPERDNIKR